MERWYFCPYWAHKTRDNAQQKVNCENPKLIRKKTFLEKRNATNRLPWFQRFIFIIFIAKGRGKINLWLKAAIGSSSRANQFELGSDPDSVS
jgi:hypothetical protein